jgi:hypothetical protein
VLALSPHTFLDTPLLVHLLGLFVFLDDRFQLIKIDVLGGREDDKEEVLVDEYNSLVGFLNIKRVTIIGRRLVLTLLKYSVSSFSREGMMNVSSLLSVM